MDGYGQRYGGGGRRGDGAHHTVQYLLDLLDCRHKREREVVEWH
jgi:hypothetical protein